MYNYYQHGVDTLSLISFCSRKVSMLEYIVVAPDRRNSLSVLWQFYDLFVQSSIISRR